MNSHRKSNSRGRSRGPGLTVVTLAGLLSLAAAVGAEVANAAAARTAPALLSLDTATRLRVSEILGRQPIRFEENGGQLDPAVRYVARSRGYDLFLARDEAVVLLRGSSPELGSAVMRMRAIGGRSARLTPMDPLPGRTHYLVGNDPSRWKQGQMSYGRVRVHDVYPGVDILYYGNERQLEFDVVVAPGVDPAVVTLGFGGSDALEVDGAGDLVVRVAGRPLRVRKPVVYQEHAGGRQEILGSYVLRGPDRVGFRIGAYDSSQPLVIDPVLLHSTYLGGSGGGDGMSAATVDAGGSVYIAGYTNAIDFPTTEGALQPEFAGSPGSYQRDAVVTKLGPDGTLQYSTYLGGTNDDLPFDIAADSLGRAWVVGYTWSSDFPTPDPPPGASNGFVVQLSADGSALARSRFLGGSANDIVSRVVLDGSGSVYLTGHTSSADFPTKVPVQPSCAREHAEDVFVAKLDATATDLDYSTCLGGNAHESARGILVDASGNVYVTGTTFSTDFPTRNAVQGALAGGAYAQDAFLSKLDGGGALVYSTYLGGYGYENEQLHAFTVDAGGNAYIAGQTGAGNFPTANAFQPTLAGSYDGYVTKLDGQGAFVYSTYLGGSSYDSISAIATDAGGNAYLTGTTQSANFPVTAGVLQPNYGGQGNAFATKLSPTGALAYSTFLGGTGSAGGYGLAVDSTGRVYVVGSSRSPDFPTPPADWPPCPDRGGSYSDAFVAKLDAAATALVYSVCLGGSSSDSASRIFLDASGNALVVGTTSSSDFPTTPGAPQPAYGGGWSDAFIARIGDALPPTVGLSGSFTVDEGGSIELTATGSDPQGLSLSYDWDLDGNGTFELDNAGPTVTYSAEALDGPQSTTVAVRVTSTANLTATASATLAVVNVAPTAAFSAVPAQVIAGQCVTLALGDPVDPAAADVAAGLRYSFDCDADGVPDVADGATPTFVCHTAAAPGLFPVATIADDDGGSTQYGATVVVLSAQDAIEQHVVAIVEELVATGVLNQGEGNALLASAEAAIAALDAGDIGAAVNVLGALLHKLDADVKTGRMPADIGEILRAAVQRTITVLEARSGGGDGSCPAV